MNEWLVITRELYNSALQERRDAWRKQRKDISRNDQILQLPEIRKIRPDVAEVPSLVLRGALFKLERTFNNFLVRRRDNAANAGYPRFKSEKHFRSIVIADVGRGGGNPGRIVAGGKRTWLPRIGKVKIKLHRPLEGKPKELHLILDNGKWFILYFCVDIPAVPLPKTEREVGIDLGLTHFAACSDGEIFNVPRPRKVARLIIERAQRRMMKKKFRSSRWKRAYRAFAKHHQRVRNIRREGHIKVARSLVAKYDSIFMEALTPNLPHGMLGSEFQDAGFGLFTKWLLAKAEEAGRVVIEVDPRYTSQTCPQCGVVAKKTLKDRRHRCACGLDIDRDVAAAQVILALGKSARRDAVLVKARRRPAEIKSTHRPDHTDDALGDT